MDATVAEQVIRYPRDLNLLNEARELSEKIIDHLYRHTDQAGKPRTYRRKARQQYLALVKRKRPSNQTRRRAIKQQLQYLRRNLKHIQRLWGYFPPGTRLPLPGWLLYRYWVIRHVYDQQWLMYQRKSRCCADRIVSISQPYVRPIKRGKINKSVEFGAKLSVSMNGDGIACVDKLHWSAELESQDLPVQVEYYRQRYGTYRKKVIADPLYGTRANRKYLKDKGIQFAGKPLGRPKKVTPENESQLKAIKRQRREDYLLRIPIEDKFGQGKGGYRLNHIRAKRADTSFAWINSILLGMNLLVLLRIFLGSEFGRWVKTIMRIRIRIAEKATQMLSPYSFLRQQEISKFPRYVTL